MILLLDIGNTRVKWAQLLDGELTPQQSMAHRSIEPEMWMKDLFRERFRPSRLLVANVAGEPMRVRVAHEARRLWQIEAEFAAPAAHAMGITHAYADVSAHGVDRWLAMIAAYRISGGAICVIDAGTAMTVDGVTPEGRHLGGLIIPGVQMMIDSLLDRTREIAQQARKLSHAAGAASGTLKSSILATGTAQAVANGALLAAAASADAAIAEVTRAARITPKVFVTGGDAERVQRVMKSPSVCIPDLVLQGLAMMAR